MASKLEFIKSVTGSATNTLGTLGRSIFNSTLGSYADSDTMNQIYSAVDKLTNTIETTSKTIDNEALNGRNKADDLYSLIAGMDIKSSYDFMNKNREFMKRLMRLNKQERDITLDAIGVDASGKSNVITNEHVKDYDHVKGNNYLEDYVKTLPQNQQIGDETTTLQLESTTHKNFSGIHNELYTVSENLYPDEGNKGAFSNKWIVENKNSLMYKTKKLFNSKKIGTIISSFHTDPNRSYSSLDNAKSKYGLSRGRNLLNKRAETGANSSYVNGYDNPYCRVWTHHHQYDRLYKSTRPFSSVDSQGNYSDTMSLKDFHQFPQFSDKNDNNEFTKGKWGWKKDSNNGWQYSVLQDNGKVNITPKYVRGEASNIHTKQCMFSIENLAWRGYDPYSFEQALSWEQRGPLGGRIMWFPPYGIQFQETTNTDWQANTFLGRGEQLYTYANTTRTGSLSFMMVVDHPSIIDYVTWTNANKTVTDTDILRFFAGCGETDGEGLRQYATPTPLTDEYTQKISTATYDQEIKEKKKVDEGKDNEKIISFYVFYPNNYSGVYDDPQSTEHSQYGSESLVEPIPYLLAGCGAQKDNCNILNNKYSNFAGDISTSDIAGLKGNGYEMANDEISGDGAQQNKDSGNYIVGTSAYDNGDGRLWKGLGTDNNKNKRNQKYIKTDSRKWKYRIDGRYTYPICTNEEKINYYNQHLEEEDGYADKTSFQLNQSIENLYKYLGNDSADRVVSEIEKKSDNYVIKDKNNSSVYTLAEMAYALYNNNNKIQTKCGSFANDNRVKTLINALKTYDIEKIEGVGFASAQGYTELNKELARNRYYTAAHWFIAKKNLSLSPTTPTIGTNELTKEEDKRSNGSIKGDPNTVRSKVFRRVRVDIYLKAKATDKVSDASRQNAENSQNKVGDLVKNNGTTTSVTYNPTNEVGYCKTLGKVCKIYKDATSGKKWYRDEDSENRLIAVEYDSEVETIPKARYGNGNTDENRLRYDQEYHFFKVLKQEDPIVFNSLMDKLQYFDPAFHSMTPEGFNGRLTFLQQCMRQGNTVSASDGKFEKSANNLAFGRAPYCVLRLGDFYNQMIVIDNLSISYDPLVWDLNVEGIGVQPLIANVQLSFKFIGGGDLTGPVRRLQNAMSFNYYANARLYDNRADRIERRWSDKTCGAIEHDEILSAEGEKAMSDKYGENKNGTTTYSSTYNPNGNMSSFYTTQMAK